MKLHKYINKRFFGVSAEVFRNGDLIAQETFMIGGFFGCYMPASMEAAATEKAYKKANEWADSLIKVELEADHGADWAEIVAERGVKC